MLTSRLRPSAAAAAVCRLCRLRQSVPVSQVRRRFSDQREVRDSPAAAADDAAAAVADEVPESDELPELGPCAVDLFLGKVNPRLLVFPELDSESEVRSVHELGERVEQFFSENLDSSMQDRECITNQSVLNWLKQQGLMGQSAPPELGGLGLSPVAKARVSEALGQDAALSLTISGHQQLAMQCLLEFGTEQQQRDHVPQLASGASVGAFCLAEAGADASFGHEELTTGIQCTLGLEAGNTEQFVLNGSKIWVTNGPIADVFIVFAKLSTDCAAAFDSLADSDGICAVIVDRSSSSGSSSISCGPAEQMLGASAAAVSAVHFHNTPVPVANLLGDIGDGVGIALAAMHSARAEAGGWTAGSLKLLMRQMVQLARQRRHLAQRPAAQQQLVQARLADLAVSIYAVESVTYLNAFLTQLYPHYDFSLEQAMLKVLASESGSNSTSACIELAGMQGLMRDLPYERCLRDARVLLQQHGANDALRMYIAGKGLRHTALTFSKLSIKERFRTLTAKMGSALPANYHPNVFGVANHLEQSMAEFVLATRQCINYYKQDIMQQQLVLARMADCAIDIYTLLACLARASRAKSIGLRSADHELDLLVMLSKQIASRMEANIAGISSDNFFARFPDAEMQRISDYSCKFGGYSVDHPLNRNWD